MGTPSPGHRAVKGKQPQMSPRGLMGWGRVSAGGAPHRPTLQPVFATVPKCLREARNKTATQQRTAMLPLLPVLLG